jgi:hypothetical protein
MHELKIVPDSINWEKYFEEHPEGMGFFSQGKKWASHVVGSRTTDLICASEEEGIMEYRNLCSSLMGLPKDNKALPYSYSGLSKKIEEYICYGDFPLDPEIQKYCEPGEKGFIHSSSYEGEASYYDLSHAFGQILEMLSSYCIGLRFESGKLKLDFIDDEKKDWGEYIRELNSNKKLKTARLVCVGQGLAGYNFSSSISSFHGGKKSSFSPPYRLPSQKATSYLLARRGIFEITQEECFRDGAIIAIVDAVVLSGSREPEFWKQLGLQYSLKDSGPSEIRFANEFRIGSRKTLNWKEKGEKEEGGEPEEILMGGEEEREELKVLPLLFPEIDFPRF